ncbi:hypothetical protein SK128_020004 [Halocaridina rubra]|uniref:Uncharacterized protein n=1 Tax=Halocaridina rubra TaxID=373956 RepID=A0AAN8WKJ7_HALRR
MDFLEEREKTSWDWQGRYLVISLSSKKAIKTLSHTYKIRRTPNVLFLIPGRQSKGASLYTHNLYGSPRIELLATLENTKDFPKSWENSRIEGNLPIFPKQLRNLHGEEVRVVSFNHPPTMFAKDHNNGSLTTLAGVDYWFIQSLGKALNFRPVFISTGPAQWGIILDNGTYTGIVGKRILGVHSEVYTIMKGQVQRGIGDIGVADLFITYTRAQYVAFTVPYTFSSACLLTPAPKELPRWMSIFYPFSLPVWIITIESYRTDAISLTGDQTPENTNLLKVKPH